MSDKERKQKEIKYLILEFLDNLKSGTEITEMDENGVSMIAGMMGEASEILKNGTHEDFEDFVLGDEE